MAIFSSYVSLPEGMGQTITNPKKLGSMADLRGQVAGPRPSSVKSDVDGESQVALGEVGEVPAMATTEFANKFRFRNHISTIQEPKSNDSATKIPRFRDQKTIQQPKY